MQTTEDKVFTRSWQPYSVVFTTNVCIMILELIAGRMIAPHVGVSLYTWTSIIGVVLAGISVGNFLGGNLADKHASRKLLAYLILAAGLLCVTVFLGAYLGAPLNTSKIPIILQILILTTAMFFLPSMVLGMVSPVVAKLAVNDLSKTGSIVGRIYAAGAFGSILGTFLTGFFLISWIGTYAIVFGVAAILFLLAITILFSGKVKFLVLPFIVIIGGLGFLYSQGAIKGICKVESDYFCIRVIEEVKDGERIRTLILDKLVHSITNIDNPLEIEYGYTRTYAEATEFLAQQNPVLRAAFIGGGGYTFPYYLELAYPESQMDVIEIDPAVTAIAYSDFGIPADTRIVTYNMDARLFFKNETPPAFYDIVYGDAFNGLSVPYHLTTHEFNQLVYRALKPGGFYIINAVDMPNGRFILSYVVTLQQTFEHVYLINPYQDQAVNDRITFVVLATDQALDAQDFAEIDAGDGETTIATAMLTDAALEGQIKAQKVVTLTDNYAPVEQLLISVYNLTE